MSVHFKDKKVLDHHRLGVPKGKELSAKSLTKNPKARWDGMAMCDALFKKPVAVYKACEALAASLQKQYSSKRCVSIAELTDLTPMRKVPGLKSNSGYSAVRFARSIVFQEWPSSQKFFADTEEDWAKWRVMGGDLNVIKALGIGIGKAHLEQLSEQDVIHAVLS